MEWIIYAVVFFAVLAVIGVIASSVRGPGAALQTKAKSLGNMTLLTRTQIIAVLGSPSAISAAPDGRQLLQWQATGYHIALLFDGETCLGVTHEFAA